MAKASAHSRRRQVKRRANTNPTVRSTASACCPHWKC